MATVGADPAPGRERFPARRRIRTGGEIRTLLRRGKRRRTSHLDVFLSASPASFARLGLIVPKHRRTIVERNRLKRRLREIGRRDLLPRLDREGCAVDLLVRARREAYQVSWDTLRTQLLELVEELCSDRS